MAQRVLQMLCQVTALMKIIWLSKGQSDYSFNDQQTWRLQGRYSGICFHPCIHPSVLCVHVSVCLCVCVRVCMHGKYCTGSEPKLVLTISGLLKSGKLYQILIASQVLLFIPISQQLKNEGKERYYRGYRLECYTLYSVIKEAMTLLLKAVHDVSP